jgi:hypothetical protein
LQVQTPAEAAAAALAAGQQSDHLLMAAAYGIWRGALRSGGRNAAAAAARRHSLSQQVRMQILLCLFC